MQHNRSGTQIRQILRSAQEADVGHREFMPVNPESKESKKRPKASRFEGVGRRMDEEVEEFIRWFNDEAVPSTRHHSSRALRKASAELSKFADYMDSRQRKS